AVGGPVGGAGVPSLPEVAKLENPKSELAPHSRRKNPIPGLPVAYVVSLTETISFPLTAMAIRLPTIEAEKTSPAFSPGNEPPPRTVKSPRAPFQRTICE